MNCSDNDTYVLLDILVAGSVVPVIHLTMTSMISYVLLSVHAFQTKTTLTYRILVTSIYFSTIGISVIMVELHQNLCELTMGMTGMICMTFAWMTVYRFKILEVIEIQRRLVAVFIFFGVGTMPCFGDIVLIKCWFLHGNLMENSILRYLYLIFLSVRLTCTATLVIRYCYYQIWSNRQKFRLDIFRRHGVFTRLEDDSVTDIKEKFVRMKQLVKKIHNKIRPETDTNDLPLNLTEQSIGDLSTNRKLLVWIQNLSDELDSTINLIEDGKNAKMLFIVDPSPSEATSGFIADLKTKMLKAKVKLIPMESSEEIEQTSENDRILVICSITSRFDCNLGVIRDIKAAYHPRIVLILLYCNDYGNLPSNSNNVHKAKATFPRMKGVVEMAFQGCIYRCSMNDKALSKIGAKRKWYQVC